MARGRKGFRKLPSALPPNLRGRLDEDKLFSGEESAFLKAAEAYRAARHLKFMKATDYLKVLLALGYRRRGPGRPPKGEGPAPALAPGAPRGFDAAKAIGLYRAGMTDAAVAAGLGCPQSAVWKWRQREGLPPNHERYTRKKAGGEGESHGGTLER
jgi:hypothetical protein